MAKEMIIQGFVIRDTNDDGIIDEVDIDWQNPVTGHAGTKTVTLSIAGKAFMQDIFSKVGTLT